MSSIILSIDAMGGDTAPTLVIEGLALALQKDRDLQILLYGDEGQIKPLLAAHPHLHPHIELRHTDSRIGPDVKPAIALRTGKGSSMHQAIEAVAQGTAQGVVSAGNTGAYMALSLFTLRPLSGIHRPAICTPFPTMTHSSAVLLDVGANVECSPQNLLQFALMGQLFAQVVLGKQAPTVGLLNVGSEETKGNSVLQEAAGLLREHAGIKSFHGFIEGDDIMSGRVDVAVTDGFTGNVALKTAEGTTKMIVSFLRQAFTRSLRAKIGYLLAKSALDELLKQRLDPRKYNGALFLGLNGVAVKSHGGTDAVGFANAVEVTAKIVREGLNDQIRQALGVTA